MTNGEKFKEIFEVSQVDEGELYVYVWLSNHTAIEFSIDWWNALYKAESEKKHMKEVELVIKIPEEVYIKLSNSNPSYADDFSIYYAIKDGRVLPKSHDRLVEAHAVVKALFSHETIDDVPTIIEADSSEEE